MRCLNFFGILMLVFTLASCSSSRHVPQGSYLLDDVDIIIPDSSKIEETDLVNYLRQTPNHKVLGFMKLQLATYNLSGRDTTRWYNRWLRRLGQPPVIYDPSSTEASVKQLRQALINKGYMDANVFADTIRRDNKRKISVDYLVNPGLPHYISSVSYDIPDTAIRHIVMADTAVLSLKPGDPFDRTVLDDVRTDITHRLRNRGYYAFTKEYITFFADTAARSRAIDLTLNIRPPRTILADHIPESDETPDSARVHHRFRIDKVIFFTDARPGDPTSTVNPDTVSYRQIQVVYGDDHYIRPSILEEKCFIVPGHIYRAAAVDRTYEAIAQLGIIKSVYIELVPAPASSDSIRNLNAYIFLQRNKKQNVTLELEGTNSEGDLGFGIGFGYQHRNLGKRSNLLSTKFRMSYESLSGNLSGLINDRFTEYTAEVGITFPKFMFPFMPRSFTRKVKASTEFAVSFNFQERPEYTRIIAGGAWKYKWSSPRQNRRHVLDLIDINYVYLPKSTIDFINQIAPSNPLLRYSYEDHFIMRLGYSFYRTNKRIPSITTSRKYAFQRYIFSLRAAAETAGNLLYAISSLSHQKRDDDVYKIFGIQYSQYAKVDFDYSLTRNFNTRHSIAFHVGAGIGVPFGNSRVLPFEKRFYAGGANGVRGWGVRTLGPGNFDSRNSVADFINQCGDIRLDLNAEYRMKLFWVFEGALILDAGNIWTIHNYENQPGGMFRLSSFWKQIAMSYGAGIRLDFSYFLLRLDLGLKAYNPARNQERWPIIHPRWGRDATFHFSVGYPF